MNRHNMNIRIHDLCGIMLCLLFFFHRAIPIDYSSLWQIGILCIVYVLSRQLDQRFILIGIAVWSTIESLLAILQKLGCISSNHPMFDVTGSFGNPGPLGGLLAVGLLVNAVFLYDGIKRKSYRYSIAYAMFSLLVVVGLWLSQSRAGWMAVWTGGFFLLCSSMYRRMYRKRFYLCLFSLFIFFLLFFAWAYLLKKNSADGRLLIWLNTWHMVLDNPLCGLGTGGWLSNYMHYQAEYFMQHPDSSYLMLADNVAYPYNEYLLLLAEHGIIGLLCLVFFWAAILLHKNNGKVEKALLLSFMTFAFFSYPSSVFALQILFVVMLGMVKSHPICQCTHYVRVTRMATGLLMVLLISLSIHSAYIYHRVYGNIQTLIEGKNVDTSLRLLDGLLPYFRYNSKLMYFYSIACVERQLAENKLPILEETLRLIPTSELFCDIGDVWKERGNFSKSESCYMKAMNMVPSRLTPKYKLFHLYKSYGMRKEALILRDNILETPLKKESTKELRIKGEVKNYQ